MLSKFLEEEKQSKQWIFSSHLERYVTRALMISLSTNKYEHLTSLCFWNCDLGDEGAIDVAKALPSLPNVSKLEMMDNQLTASTCAALAVVLKKRATSRLTILRLDHNRIGTEGVLQLLDGLHFNSTLRTLSLAFCHLPAACGTVLQKLLKVELIGIRNLNLEGNPLGNEGVSCLADGIFSNKTLTALNIAQTEFGNGDSKSIAALTGALKNAVQLTSINLDGNAIGNEGCQYFLQHLTECKHIQEFVVTPLKIDPKAFQLLCAWVQANKPPPPKMKKRRAVKKRTVPTFSFMRYSSRRSGTSSMLRASSTSSSSSLSSSSSSSSSSSARLLKT
eukprot:TRINITY_DN2285_c0_g1_i1.p1 TRINITY_DN2285_c0_g1~~TRINITY_DN2285_c0_g1_i1.p1  ORF type:complete len:334 (-),score=84.27 TRINITY_DN2285_c0_g1_i1:182-1183(-)